MADPHAQAIQSAQHTSDLLTTLFARLGTAEHPRGMLLSAYRQARRALRGNVANLALVEEILFDLRVAVETALRIAYQSAGEVGMEQAKRELSIYGMLAPLVSIAQESEQALAASLAALDVQIASARVIANTTADQSSLIGDGTRVGLLSPAPVARQARHYTALLALSGHRMTIRRANAGNEFMRQAVATIASNTTETCLRVHGQVVTLDGAFRLTGTPRYADRLQAPPFHDDCRTVVALVLRKYRDDELTRQMGGDARAELRTRATIQARIDALKRQLADLQAAPDVRVRQADNTQVRNLRAQLRYQQGLLRAEIRPASATGGR
jgi:hypothetical protein